MEHEELGCRFSYHKPDAARAVTHEQLREEFHALAGLMNVLLPESREKALAVTNLEQSLMWANAAVARRS